MLRIITKLTSSVVKTTLIPVAVVKDVVNVVVGEKPNATENLLTSVVKDVDKAIDEATGE